MKARPVGGTMDEDEVQEPAEGAPARDVRVWPGERLLPKLAPPGDGAPWMRPTLNLRAILAAEPAVAGRDCVSSVLSCKACETPSFTSTMRCSRPCNSRRRNQ